ncbi:hypothetical protein ZIOFF_071761 [Zingiber officinale]|uniref:FYVE-type domain-containing protein n=1 Tax=Zingiber officinale TaxID=94328 RepID=A0A8J5EUK3_ZINOF|nr:hypothetical protein ZIOFF_071761 [Zingiber officinale]
MASTLLPAVEKLPFLGSKLKTERLLAASLVIDLSENSSPFWLFPLLSIRRVSWRVGGVWGYHDKENGSYLVDPDKGASWLRLPKHDCLFQSSSDDFLDQGNQSQNSFHRTQPSQLRANPEVNLKNVLNGLYSILVGRNQADSASQPQLTSGSDESPSSDISFFGVGPNGDSFLHRSVCVPSAPPFDVEAINCDTFKDMLEADPPEWIPDSYSRVCMQCDSPFTVITRGRHHCRFCGCIFCRECTKGRCLLPVKFRERNPQRVCDSCYDRLDPLQSILIVSNSNSVQSAKHDVTDWTCMRGWLNFPVGMSMEYEIYKATNTLRSYFWECGYHAPHINILPSMQVARLDPEKSIPWVILKGAKGLAILTVIKAGALLTYKVGTGLVVSRRVDGSWSAPSAILSIGLGWGAQMGGELTDFIIVLHGSRTVKAFSSNMHVSVGAGLSAAAGPVGRVFEADVRASSKGSGMCYTYSCSKGAFVGVSLESNFVATRTETNLRFYGDPYLTTNDILFGTVKRPTAAEPLYLALNGLYSKLSS